MFGQNGLGCWTRNRHELLLFAVRGSFPAPFGEDVPDSLINADRRAHSQKPDSVYELFRSGTRLLEDGDCHAAVVPLARARDLDPEKTSIREALGRALFGSRRQNRGRSVPTPDPVARGA